MADESNRAEQSSRGSADGAETLSASLRRARDVMDRDFADERLDLDRIAGVAFLS
jgi:hypothetical protein